MKGGQLTTLSWGKEPQVRYTPDGRALLCLGGGYTAGVKVRDPDSGRLRFALSVRLWAGSYFRSFSFSDDSRLLATMVFGQNHIQVCDLATRHADFGSVLPRPGGLFGLFSVRFSPDGRYLLAQPRGWSGSLLGLAKRQTRLPSAGPCQRNS